MALHHRCRPRTVAHDVDDSRSAVHDELNATSESCRCRGRRSATSSVRAAEKRAATRRGTRNRAVARRSPAFRGVTATERARRASTRLARDPRDHARARHARNLCLIPSRRTPNPATAMIAGLDVVVSSATSAQVDLADLAREGDVGRRGAALMITFVHAPCSSEIRRSRAGPRSAAATGRREQNERLVV